MARNHPQDTPELFSTEPSNPKRSGIASAATEFDVRLGDCVAGMAELPAECVDVVVTSPPYNLGIRYRTHQDGGPRDEYLEWSDRCLEAVRRVLKPDGSLFLNIGAAPANPWLPHEVILRVRDRFVLQNTIHWVKSITVQPRNGPEVSAGHFKPLQGTRFLNDCHEYIFH